MKKLQIVLFFLFVLSGLAYGQLDVNRTVATKLADALAVLPAEKEKVLNQAMADIASTGQAGLSELIDMRETSTGEARVRLDFALNSITVYATSLQDPVLRKDLQQVYIKAIEKLSKPESKAFYMNLLGMVGDDASVGLFASFLNNASLSDNGARGLAKVKSEKAVEALIKALMQVKPDLKKNVMNALGEIASSEAEDALLAQEGKFPAEDTEVWYFALSRCGSAKSLPVLTKAAREANYSLDRKSGNEAYIFLLNKLAEGGEKKITNKAASDLYKNDLKENQVATRIAALQILLKTDDKNRAKLIVKALNDPEREYRNAALLYAEEYKDADLSRAIAGKLKKADAETQMDIINWLGKNRIAASLEEIIPYVKSTDSEVSRSAIIAVARIGGDEAIACLAGLVASGEKNQLENAACVLKSMEGDIATPLMNLFSKASTEGQKTILQLIGSRKCDRYAKAVLELAVNAAPEVKETALGVLREVVTAENLPQLYELLKNVSATEVEAVQQAIISALNTLPDAERYASAAAQMKKETGNSRDRYFSILAATGDPAAFEVIQQGFAEGNAETQQQAFKALLLWPGFEVTDALYEICKNNEKEKYFDPAFNAYVAKIAGAVLTGEQKLLLLRKALEIAQTTSQKKIVLEQIQKTGTFLGLIVAGKYLEDNDLQQTACQAVMNIALANKAYYGEEVSRLLNRVLEVLSGTDSDYQKQAIRKHLAELPEGEGFVSIFNGKDLTGWKGLVGNPITRTKMSATRLAAEQKKADKLMRESWSVEEGMLVFNGKGDNLCTDKKYGDFEMYIDWKLYPEGKEADAGIYLRGTPQVQIWDTARRDVGAQVGSGGLYNNETNLRNPLQVADNFLGEWNSFFIRMIGERVSVWLNGIKVVDNVIFENYWDRTQPVPFMEQIELQAHGSKVAYRDIYVREIPRVEPYEVSSEEAKEGFRALFNGVYMHNWTGNTKDYVAENGCIVLYPENRGGGNLYTKEEFSDFVFRFEFMLTPGANNGLGIRTPTEGDAAYVGMELQILDNEDPIYKNLKKYQYHGSVYGIIPARRGFLKPIGEWNYQEVIAKGNRIKVILNGEVILDGDIQEATLNGTMDKREHPGLFNKKGHIGFLGHGSVVKFKNIRVKELK